MPTSDLAAHRVHVDPTFVRRLVLVNGAVPLALLAVDAWRHALGADGVKYALHTTGLLALLFFVLSLVVTPLKRVLGWNELVAGRRALGLYGFFYLVVHFAIFFLFDRAGSVRSTVHEILTRRYLQLGMIALVLFVPLAVTSTDRMITRLGPRRWKRLHRLTYAATTLGVIHYILLVKADLRQPVAFAVLLGALLAFRAGAYVVDRGRRARRRPWSGELRVERMIDETPDVRTFRLVASAGGELPFRHRPGQYLTLSLVVGGARVNRSYTIASSPTERGFCEITVKKVDDGTGSRHLHASLRPGATVKVTAPAGRFVFDGTTASRVLLLAGGVGITPLMAMARYLVERRWSGRIDLVLVARTQRDVIFAHELDELAARSKGLHVHVTLTREPAASAWAGRRGPLTKELLEEVTPGLRTTPIFLCGPEPMMIAARELLAAAKVPAANVAVEAFVSPPRGPVDRGEGVAEEAAERPVRPGAATVQFLTSSTTTSIEGETTLLEAAEDAGVDIPFDCRAGICGQCKTKLVRGRVVMDVDDALTSEDRKRHLVLACQARPIGDVVLEA